MLFVGIFENIFSASALSYFQSWFLWDCHIVFFSIMIFFINSRFILFSCVKVIFVVLVGVVVWFSVFCVLVGIVWSCCYYSQFCYISCISRSENQSFFYIIPALSARLWLVVLDLTHDAKITIILFLYAFCVGLLLSLLLFYSFESFFTLAWVDGFPLESESQQVFSSLQNSSQYSGRF